MTDHNANRPGYKKSRVGWIPEEWDVKRFREIARRRSERYDPQDPENPDSKCIKLSNIEQETGSINGYIWAKEQKSSKNIFHINDVLFGKLRPYLRKFYFADFKGVCSSEIWVFIANKSIVPKFLFYLVQTNKFINLANVTTGTKMPRADWDFLRDRYFGIPLENDQMKIVKILCTWDRAIEQTRQLIDAKRRLKKGLMQQLLTGRMRFPGFGLPVEKSGELPEGWEEKRINQIGKVVSGGTPATNDERNWGGDIAWVTPNEVTQTKGPYIDSTEKTLTELGLKHSSAQVLPPNSIIVCTRATIGDCVINTIPIATNQGFKSITPDSQHEEKYIYYLIIFNKKKLLRLGAGSTFLEVSRRDFEKMQFLVPIKLNEQIKISELLIEIDDQILLQEKRIKHYSQQKNGLMQKLLTGEIRAKI